ncbi:ABC transporter substrate binding protein [Dendrosporobacter sp. 1207_IL3150]|uniref:ABC transporter substrate binding protein n=1 Tax=Dendrosporobacter sp. 1207_IL3150 TaxID=3084054 RepID=UPI002FD922D8
MEKTRKRISYVEMLYGYIDRGVKRVYMHTRKKNLIKIISILLMLLFIATTGLVWANDLQKKNVLVINSYNKGYKWTDNIVEGIASVLEPYSRNLNIIVEDMDRKRITDDEYIYKLYEIYKYKFKNVKFDVIVCSDDDAYQFIIKYHDELFPNTPIVFCGVNYFEEDKIAGDSLITGVVEAQDLAATIELALNLHPNIKDIYIINDKTTTGYALDRSLHEVLPSFAGRVNFISLANLNMSQIQAKVQSLPDDALVLYLVMFRDVDGNYFNYNESIEMISAKSRVPIYGCWDFSLRHGIVGGMLTSGYYQGEAAAKMALKILNGVHPKDIPILKQSPNHYMFDAVQLQRYGINKADLPENSLVINDSFSESKQVLVLNSYHHGMSWTDSIEKGIKSVFSGKNIELYIDFMDSKRNNGPEFTQKLYEVYKDKFGTKRFDAVIATDDTAYRFLLKYHNELFTNVPIVFCGVNYFEDADLVGHEQITGVVEAIDIKKTLEIALRLHPKTSQFAIINDRTATGLANKYVLQEAIAEFPQMNFVFLEGLNMSELQERVNGLPKDTIVLMMTFNQDKSNNLFSYEQSVKLISQSAKVPIYSVWDFYLGQGIVGGMMTSGFSQGELAAQMILRILNGEKPALIPVVKESPNRYMFDYNQLTKFGIDTAKLPPDSIVINTPESAYNKYKTTIWSVVGAFTIITLVVQRKRAEERLKYYATIDSMTGVFNRRTGLDFLEKQMEIAKRGTRKLTICFIDVNNLKVVNDSYGHQEGDYLIKTISSLLEKSLRKSDIICRFGGDEFLLVFPDSDIEQAKSIWERIEDNISTHNSSGIKPYNLSVSRGFAQFDKNERLTVDEFVIIADKAMYEEKSYTKENSCKP